jgi:serine/threonine protein kinase
MSRDDGSVAADVDAGTPEDMEAVRIFDAYLAEVQAGRPADPDRLIAEHPGIAGQLQAFLNVTRLVGHLAGEPEPKLDDYRIVREIGRGGMGIVYEAVQRSRGRRVALKVLPSAGALDPRQLRRFQVEVQAAQLLRHPHIVPISSFGCERRVHYYAMQFIEGQDLAERIMGFRTAERDEASAGDGPGGVSSLSGPSGADGSPSNQGRRAFREVARWGLQAAEALDYAHGLGVLHRDIKPSNLMIDAHGNLWVTDFGLVQVQGENGMTQTGDLLGTLRYMSPEQALAGRVVIDGRTDVYSLGVTLYELLTLHPAFEGHDRQELLRRTALEEPRTPVASRRRSRGTWRRWS